MVISSIPGLKLNSGGDQYPRRKILASKNIGIVTEGMYEEKGGGEFSVHLYFCKDTVQSPPKVKWLLWEWKNRFDMQTW